MALGDGRFKSLPVRLGIESGDRIAIRSGLRAGETVVVSGQFLIDSESNIETALARMNDAHAEDRTEQSATPDESSAMDANMDHSQHEMESPEASDDMDSEMDHSQHQMDDEL